MGESTKAVLGLILLFTGISSVFSWCMIAPHPAIWAFRVGLPLLFCAALACLLALNARADLAPDYLRKIAGNYFCRDGFCFTIGTAMAKQQLYVNAFFQNQYDQPCFARIRMRPINKGFMGTRRVTLTFVIECAPAAFGFARAPLPVPAELKGTHQVFEVGMDVQYPHGKGRRMRFFDGMFLRTNGEFGNALAATLTILGALGGAIVFSKPATVKLHLPVHASGELPPESPCELFTLWKLGDPDLPDEIRIEIPSEDARQFDRGSK